MDEVNACSLIHLPNDAIVCLTKNKSVHFFCNKVLLQLICQVFAYSASVMYIQRYVYCQLNGHLNIFKEISIIYKAVMMVRYIPMIYICSP